MLTKDFEMRLPGGGSGAREGAGSGPKVEIKPRPDVASRVEGIIGVDGPGRDDKGQEANKTRQELAFAMVKEICTDSRMKEHAQGGDTHARDTGSGFRCSPRGWWWPRRKGYRG